MVSCSGRQNHPAVRSLCNSVTAQMIFGGHKAVVRPDPIPNSAVKHSLADGSGCIASARVGCRQFFLKAETNVSAFFVFVTALDRTDENILDHAQDSQD